MYAANAGRKRKMKRLTPEENEFLHESNAIENEYSEQAFKDAVKAWRYGLLNREYISLSKILKIHRKSMSNLEPDIAGKIRNVPVYIGGEIRSQSEGEIFTQLEDWCENWATEKTEQGIKKAHVVFEKIHPFVDGNGRVGRILMNLQRIKEGLPILIIKEKEKYEYYKWFNEKK